MKLIVRWARQFGLARAVCTLLLFALVPLRIADPRPLEELRLRTFDLLQVLRPRQQTARPVVIADIDEASLKEIGQWPWPRTVVADLVTRLRELGAVAIGFDIVFAEPDRMSPALAAESFRGLDAATRDKLAALPSNDEVLADAIKQAGVVVVGQAGAATPAPRSASRDGAADRLRHSRPRSAPVPGDVSRLAAQRSADRGGGRRPRAVLDQARARRHHPPRPGGHGRAGYLGAVADHGNAARRHPRRRHPRSHRPSRRARGGGARP